MNNGKEGKEYINIYIYIYSLVSLSFERFLLLFLFFLGGGN